jgi:HPt (histidine-containing phosphotransfer) domain-containing protein
MPTPMMDDLRAAFLPKFVALARSRTATVIGWLARRDQAAQRMTVREIHSLAGDAALLGLTEVASLGHACEQQVKLLHTASTEAEIEQLAASMRQLVRLIDGLGPRAP